MKEILFIHSVTYYVSCQDQTLGSFPEKHSGKIFESEKIKFCKRKWLRLYFFWTKNKTNTCKYRDRHTRSLLFTPLYLNFLCFYGLTAFSADEWSNGSAKDTCLWRQGNYGFPSFWLVKIQNCFQQSYHDGITL